MSDSSTQSNGDRESEFERLQHVPPPGLIREFGEFLIQSKKWWMIPLVLIILVIGLLASMLNSPAAPLIYPFF